MTVGATTERRVRCPACGTQGRRVAAATVRALLAEENRNDIPVAAGGCCPSGGPGCRPTASDTGYRFCGSPGCDVAYFAEEGEATFTRDRLRVPVGVKETTGTRPLCYCFGHSVESVKAELRSKGRSDAPEDIRRKMKDPGCRCETENPSGSCCLGDVARGIETAKKELDMTASTPTSTTTTTPNPPQPTRPPGGRGETIAKTGTLVSAVVASSCCWLPLALLAVGVSGAGIASALEAYRPLFAAVTFGFLGAAFYFAYRPRKAPSASAGDGCCAPGPQVAEGCCGPSGGRRFGLMSLNKVTLWAVTAAAMAFLLFPSYVGVLLGGTGDTRGRKAQAADVNRTVLAVEGMTCEGCAAVAAEAIREVPGVLAVEVDYETKRAVVTTEADRPAPRERILDSLRSAGYRGRPLNDGGAGE